MELEIKGESEDHEYALDLIKNLVDVAVKDGLPSRILMEVAMVYSIQYNLENGDTELIRELFSKVLDQLGDLENTESPPEVMH